MPEQKKTFDENLIELMRHSIGLLSHRDIEDAAIESNELGGEQSEEYYGYAGRVHGVMDLLEKELKRAMGTQLFFIGTQSMNREMDLIGRGAINAFMVLWDRFNELNSVYLNHLEELKDDQKIKKDS